MATKHFDEARGGAIETLRQILADDPAIERAVLIDDLFGRIRVVLWGPKERREQHEKLVSDRMREAAGPFWAAEIWHASESSEADRRVYDHAWSEGEPLGDRLRVADRLRSRTVWRRPIVDPPWSAAGREAGPPVVVFYSFKGGVGRTVALCAVAIQRARKGERVAVLDLDLDAPGIGTLLAADERGTTAAWGVVDYLLERPLAELDLRDYYHACRWPMVTRSGEILVVPAGALDPERDYPGKLGRLDLDPPAGAHAAPPIELLLREVRDQLRPDWILLDARAGLSEPAGLLLSGLAHLHVLFGTSSEQSWLGLRLVLERIGASRVREDKPQLECVLVHAMVPQSVSLARAARDQFADRSLTEFRDHYYAPDPDDPDEDRLWYVRDAEGSDAPHVPIALSYDPRLAHFASVDEIADPLADSAEYRALADRVAERFSGGED